MSYENKQLIFAGAGGRNMGTPWGTLGGIVKKAIEPHGYKVHIESRSYGANNARYVADGKANFGATHTTHAISAYHGRGIFNGEKPRSNLRVLASVNHASWYGVAVRAQSGISGLSEIREKELPVRIKMGSGHVFDLILDYYDLSREKIESWGGTFIRTDLEAPTVPWVNSGEFDLIIDTIYAAYTPEARHWWEASILHDLNFLPLTDDLIKSICAQDIAEPGFIPTKLMRGITTPIPALARLPQLIYTRDDMPGDFAYLLVKTLDNSRHLFRETHIPFSYDPENVARDCGIALHPGAKKYYREQNYL